MGRTVETSEDEELVFSSDHTGSIGYLTGTVNGQLTGCVDLSSRPSYRPMDLPAILDRIDSRLRELGLSQDAASKLAKKPDSIRNLRRAVEAKSAPRKGMNADTLRALADILQVSHEWLVTGSGRSIGELSVKDLGEVVPNFNPPPEIFGDRDLPVFSAVEGGPGEMVIDTDPIDIVPRPWFLRSVKEGYGVLVVGESMVPVFKPGMMVLINPKLPVVPGEPAIFVDRRGGGFKATVKELVKQSQTFWLVHQWNPPEGQKHEFKLLKKDWPEAFRVVGSYYR